MYPIHWALVILAGMSVVYGLWRRVRLWRMGRPAARTDQIGRRIGGLLLYALGQRRVLSQAYPGLMHGLIFYGFVAFFIATSLVGIQLDAGVLILKGASTSASSWLSTPLPCCSSPAWDWPRFGATSPGQTG